MSNPFHLSYFLMGVSILNLLLVVAGLLLVYFDWSAARRRELLYLVFTEEKPGHSYFSSARRRRALYTRLLIAFAALTLHQFIAANLFAAISEPSLYGDYLEWWRSFGTSLPPDGAIKTVLRALHLQVWWQITEVLALVLLGGGLLYESRSEKRDTIDAVMVGMVAVLAFLVFLLKLRIGGYIGGMPVRYTEAPGQMVVNLGSWSGVAMLVRDVVFWLRFGIIAVIMAALFAQSRAEREASSFERSLILVAFTAWLVGGFFSSIRAQAAPDFFSNMLHNPAAISVGCMVALALLVAMISRHVLTEYEVMERSRHRLGRERQVIIAFLQRIGSAFSTAPELETVLDIILDSAIDTTEAHSAAIYLYDRETKALGPPVVRHFFPPLYVDTSPAYNEHHSGATEVLLAQATRQTFALKEGIIGEVASSGRARLVSDVRAEGIVQGKTTQYFRDYSMLVVPLSVRDEPQAVIAVLQKQRGSFNRTDEALLQALADQGALSINHVRLLTEVREQERLRRELQIAHDIQQRLLPDRCPIVPGFEIGAYGAAATEVGGDYYDFFEVDGDHLGIVVADVSGKGVHAALVVAMMRSAFRIQAKNNFDVKDVLLKVNDFIGNDLPRDMFITCVYGILEVSTRRFTWARAGHEPLILAHTDDSTDVLAPAGFALGVLGSPDFDQMLEVNTVMLQSGDRMLLFTDGLTEAMNSKGEEFGMQRILRVLSHADPAMAPVHPNGMSSRPQTRGRSETGTFSARQTPVFSENRTTTQGGRYTCEPDLDSDEPQDLLSMERAVESHVDGAPQSDDLTMVFLAVK